MSIAMMHYVRRMTMCRVPEEAPPEVEKLMQWCNHWDPTERPTAKQVVHYIQAMPAEPSHQRGQ